MALPPISVQLTKFENIEILRIEIEAREEELKVSEKTIRALLYEIEKVRYLKSLHPFFLQIPDPPEAATVPQLHTKREALNQAIETMKAHLAQLEGETLGQTAPPSAAGAGGLGARPKLSDLQAQRPAAPRSRFDMPPAPPPSRPGMPPPPPPRPQ